MDVLDFIHAPFRFKSKPVAVPGDYRPAWRIALIVLILSCSRSRRASLQKLHVLSWVMRTRESRARFLQLIEGKIQKHTISIRIDPTLNLAMDICVAEGLASFLKGKSLELSSKGQSMADEIEAQDDCMEEEKQFLAATSAVATEKMISDIFNVAAP